MTDRFLGMPGDGRPGGAGPAQTMLSRALTRAWWALLWERVWPPVSLLVTTFGIFLIVSWAGLWFALPPLGRAIGVALFALLLVASAYPLVRLALPTRHS